MGGLANPSVAVIDTEKQNHSGFGEISLVLPSNMVAKRTGRNAGTFFGDAWTPTYPQVERIFGKGGSDRAIADIASVPEEMQRMTRNAIDSFMDGKNADNLVYLYLQEKGIAPQLVKTKGVFSPDIRKEVISLTNRQPFYKLNETERNKVVELYIKYKFDGDRDAFEKALQERVANLIELQKEYTNPKSLLARKVKEHLENIDNYGYDYEAICRFVDDVNRDDKVSGEVSDVGTMQEARNIVKKENLQKDFEQWKEGLADRYNTKEVIFNGFTPSGNRRYVDNTLKNVSKIMKQKGRNGAEGFGFSFNNFAASIMQSNGTLKGIKERKAQLTQQHEDIDAFTDKWGEVYNHLADALNPNADISTMDVGYYRLQETAVQKKPKEYAKKEYGVELSDEDVQQLNDMVKAIREERPTMYFETKFERPVTLDEFAAAVVPKDLSADVRSGLEKAGLKLYDYDPKVEGDRKRAFDEAVHGDEGVLFRTSDELDQEYGSRWIDEQTNEDGRHTTQVKNTINSYKKFGDWVKRDSDGRNVDVLDASSGLGLGTEWLRENGINVEDVEPYPSENRTAPTYRNYDEVGKKYDYIISNAVLNVIPDDWRANVLHNMAEKLKVGGKLVINVRSAESIRKQGKEGETRITLDDPSEILVLRPNGSIKAYQKGFTKAELKEWCEKELGKGYSVEIANDKNAGGSYDTAVVVTKNNESGTIGVASEAGRPRRSAQALPSSNAKLDNNQKFANNLLVLSENLSERDMGAHEFLFNVAKAFGLNGQNLNKSFYQDLSNSVGIRISDHSANTDNITNRNVNDDVYGLVVKLSKNRFKSRSDANYLEYVYYPDKLTGERQREIVEGLNKFLQTGDYMQLPAPDRVNRSGKFDVLIDGRETSPTAKHQAANDLARQMHVEGEVEVVTSTEGLTGRQAKAKGWYDVRTGRVTIVLPNNKNAADVRETVFHEVVAHKGLRNLVGEEHFNTFLDNVYNNAEEGIKQTIDEMAEKKYEGDKRKATEEYMAHLAEDGEYVKPENQGFFAKVRDFLTDLLRKVGIKLGFKLTDNDLRYILWRSWKGLAERDGGSVFEKAEDVKMQHELGQTDEARSASGENGIMFREGSDELKDVVEKMKADIERLHEGELDDLRSGARAIGGRLSELNKAMRLQRAYDMSTVASVTELAKTMLKNGLLSEMSDYDVRRLLSVVNNVHGKGDIRPYVQKVVDMMVGNRLRNVSKAFDKLLAMRGKKVDARGVEVQGELDLAGQRMADVVWKGIGMSDDDVKNMCADAQDRMMSANGAEAAAAATDYAGWQIVMHLGLLPYYNNLHTEYLASYTNTSKLTGFQHFT